MTGAPTAGTADGPRPTPQSAGTDPAPLHISFGSCRWAAPPPDEKDPVGPDALDTLAGRLARHPQERPDLLVLLGDQIYADETSDATRAWLATRRDLDQAPGSQVADYEEYTRLYDESWLDPEIRWLLSTVPSCMIFDDHDVIDDWNTSASWVAEMRATPWWNERILSGLMSYWVYQHLGNLSPAQLTADPLYAAVRGENPTGQADTAERSATAERNATAGRVTSAGREEPAGDGPGTGTGAVPYPAPDTGPASGTQPVPDAGRGTNPQPMLAAGQNTDAEPAPGAEAPAQKVPGPRVGPGVESRTAASCDATADHRQTTPHTPDGEHGEHGEHDGTEALRSFAAEADADPLSTRWSYRRDLGRVRLLMIDSRAARVLDEDQRSLLDPEEARWMRTQVLDAPGSYDHLLIGTSLPWLLPHLIHDLEAWNAAMCRGERGARWAGRGEYLRRRSDLEHWAAFPASFDGLADLLREAGSGPDAPATINVLSGDVHHAYTAKAGWDTPAPVTAQVHQLTCSPVHNTVPTAIKLGFRFGWSGAGRVLGRRLARHGRVTPSPVDWKRSGGPWFGNQLMTLRLQGRDCLLALDRAEPGPEDGAARLVRVTSTRLSTP